MGYQIPRITVDGIIQKNKEILLVKRKNPPFQGKWALPGGFVDYGETTEEAVCREIFEETGLKTRIIALCGVYSDPKRDPRGHTISIAYALDILDGMVQAGDDACDVHFFNVHALPQLAFDHKIIIEDYLQKGG